MIKIKKLMNVSHLHPLRVVGKHIFKTPITVQYPEERLTPAKRFRGLHLYDHERCMGCGACAKICPNNCIELKVTVGPDGKKKIEEFNIFLGRCMFCGLCIDYCPGKGVLKSSPEYELAGYGRESLLYGIDRLDRTDKSTNEKMEKTAKTEKKEEGKK